MNISQHAFFPTTQYIRNAYYNDNGQLVSYDGVACGSLFPRCYLNKTLSVCTNRSRLFDLNGKIFTTITTPYGVVSINSFDEKFVSVIRVSHQRNTESMTSWIAHYPSIVFF